MNISLVSDLVIWSWGLVSVAWHKDWKLGETASLALFTEEFLIILTVASNVSSLLLEWISFFKVTSVRSLQ